MLLAVLASITRSSSALGGREGTPHALLDIQGHHVSVGLLKARRAALRKKGRSACLKLKCKLKNAKPTLKPLAWLHIPKTGTSFANTIYHYGCGDTLPPMASVDANAPPITPLTQKWPPQSFCPGSFVAGGTKLAFHPAPSFPDEFGHVVTMLRDPFALQQSMYSFLRSWPAFEGAASSWGSGDPTERVRIARQVHANRLPFSEFVQLPSVRGCQTKAILGLGCMTALAVVANPANAEELFRLHMTPRTHDARLLLLSLTLALTSGT